MPDSDDTMTVYRRIVGTVIEFELTWPTHPKFVVNVTAGSVSLIASDSASHCYSAGEWGDRDLLVEHVRKFILDHADTRALRTGKHSTWRGASWCSPHR